MVPVAPGEEYSILFVTHDITVRLQAQLVFLPTYKSENSSQLQDPAWFQLPGARQHSVPVGGAGEQLFLSGHTRLGAVQSVAHLEPATLACTNLVLEARYELVWAGPRILQVAALGPGLRHHLLLAGAGRGAARQHLPGAAAECQHQAAFPGEVSSVQSGYHSQHHPATAAGCVHTLSARGRGRAPAEAEVG